MTSALRITDHSGSLRLGEVELPPPAADEVRVEMAYAGVNPVDGYAAAGRVNPDGPLPRTLGGEGAGTVDGRAVLVAGAGVGVTRDGTWATEAVVPRSAVLPAPAGLDLRTVASAGVAGLTAWSTVVALAAVGAADRVLVLGASGGVGLAVVSLAASRGAQVWGQVRSADRSAALLAVGAAGPVVAEADGLADAAAHVRPTVVIDAISGPYVRPALSLLPVGGRYVVYGTSAGADVALDWQAVYRNGLQVLGYGGLTLDPATRRTRLAQVLRAMADGDLVIPIGETVPLAQGEGVLSRRPSTPGKVVLDLTARPA